MMVMEFHAGSSQIQYIFDHEFCCTVLEVAIGLQSSVSLEFSCFFLSASHTKARAYCNTSEVPEPEPEENKIVLPQYI